MPTVTPPRPPQPPTASPNPAPVLTVTRPPVELARLAIGGLLEAVVSNQAGKDLYLLQTPIGQLTVQTVVALPKDSNLVLQILSLSPQAQLQINAINGAVPAVALRKDMLTGQDILNRPDGIPSSLAKTTTIPSLVPGAVIKASLVRPLASPAIRPFAASPSLQVAGTTAATGPRVNPGVSPPPVAPPAVNVLKPSITTPPAAGQTQQGSRSGTPLYGAAQTPGATSGRLTSPAFPAGTQLSFRVTDVQLPSPNTNNVIASLTTSGPSALAAGKVLTGIVTGTTASGHPVVQTEAGVFSLNAQSTAPRGSVVTLAVTTEPKSIFPVVASVHPGEDTSSIFKDRRWPLLDEALQVLRDVNPAASHQLVNTVLPRPDIQLTAGLVFFLNALRGGDIRPWFGDSNMRILEKTRPNLANKLSHDFNTLGKIADDPVGADWRVALIPVNTGAQIDQIRMLVRYHDNGGEDSKPGDHGTRFILDVDLSRLGRIQLDGLVRDNGKKLDLIIRSANTLTDGNRNEIRTIFSEAADLTGLQGSVGFQASPPGFIDIPDPFADKKVGLIV